MAERHPVADLLNDEQRARVAAARFVQTDHPRWRAKVMAKIDRRWCCPFGVAIGVEGSPDVYTIAKACGVDGEDWAHIRELEDFTEQVDEGKIAPADVYVLLGVTPNAGGRP